MTMMATEVVRRRSRSKKYEKYERAVTTLLASMLRKVQLQQLLGEIEIFIDSHHIALDSASTTPAEYEVHANNKKLQIITILELMTLLSQLKFYEV